MPRRYIPRGYPTWSRPHLCVVAADAWCSPSARPVAGRPACAPGLAKYRTTLRRRVAVAVLDCCWAAPTCPRWRCGFVHTSRVRAGAAQCMVGLGLLLCGARGCYSRYIIEAKQAPRAQGPSQLAAVELPGRRGHGWVRASCRGRRSLCGGDT